MRRQLWFHSWISVAQRAAEGGAMGRVGRQFEPVGAAEVLMHADAQLLILNTRGYSAGTSSHEPVLLPSKPYNANNGSKGQLTE